MKYSPFYKAYIIHVYLRNAQQFKFIINGVSRYSLYYEIVSVILVLSIGW